MKNTCFSPSLALPEKTKIAVVCASGPSLSDKQCDMVRDRLQKEERILITVNDTYRKFTDDLDVVYCADLDWLKFHASDLRRSLNSSAVIYMPDRPNIRTYIEDLRNPIVQDLPIRLVDCYNYQGL